MKFLSDFFYGTPRFITGPGTAGQLLQSLLDLHRSDLPVVANRGKILHGVRSVVLRNGVLVLTLTSYPIITGSYLNWRTTMRLDKFLEELQRYPLLTPIYFKDVGPLQGAAIIQWRLPGSVVQIS